MHNAQIEGPRNKAYFNKFYKKTNISNQGHYIKCVLKIYKNKTGLCKVQYYQLKFSFIFVDTAKIPLGIVMNPGTDCLSRFVKICLTLFGLHVCIE